MLEKCHGASTRSWINNSIWSNIRIPNLEEGISDSICTIPMAQNPSSCSFFPKAILKFCSELHRNVQNKSFCQWTPVLFIFFYLSTILDSVSPLNNISKWKKTNRYMSDRRK